VGSPTWWETEVDAGSEEWMLCGKMRRSKKVQECWWVAITSDWIDRKHRGRYYKGEAAEI